MASTQTNHWPGRAVTPVVNGGHQVDQQNPAAVPNQRSEQPPPDGLGDGSGPERGGLAALGYVPTGSILLIDEPRLAPCD